tara:strand:+ start:149 stop:754 length:606 start_codon:yes stop_codon:yes gene_type:complete
MAHNKPFKRTKNSLLFSSLKNQVLSQAVHEDTVRLFMGTIMLQLIIPPQWQFTGRNRRPPTDPVNAMLSLGYTLLHSHTDSMLRIAGLMPWSGFYHQTHGSHAALALDLMEPFRHLVERTVLTVIKCKQLSTDDFSQHETQGVQMSQEAQKIYLTQLEKRFLTPVKVKGQSTGHSLHGHLHEQNVSLKQCLNNIMALLASL